MSYKLLLVEDQEDLCVLISMTLSQSGMGVEVITAGTVAAAEALLAESSYDLVVLDLGLPDGDGFTVLDTVRSGEGPTAADVPVLIYSARDPKKIAPMAKARGVSAHFPKSPDGFRSLRDWVEMTVFELRSAARSAL